MLLPGDERKAKKLRNPFLENLPYDNLYEFTALQKPEGPQQADLNGMRLTCEACCGQSILSPNLRMTNSQVTSNLIKLQSQMTKEILEAGVFTVVTHHCSVCQANLCLLCALQHSRKQHPGNSGLRQVISKSVLQNLVKRGAPVFEQLLGHSAAERVRDTVDKEISKLLATMKQILI